MTLCFYERSMSKLINVGDVVDAITLTEKSTCIHDNTKVEFDICLYQDEIVDSGTSKKLRTCIAIYNIPNTHYLEFKGIATSTGIYINSGIFDASFCGYMYVNVFNSSTQTRNLHSQMMLGTLALKRYTDHDASDVVGVDDEIYLHGGYRHICSENCTRVHNIEK